MQIRDSLPTLPVEDVVDGWRRHSITPNPEYQRGRSWKPDQQKLLVDSVLRGYPLPRFYFALNRVTDPLGNEATTFEIIDGLQRIVSLGEFLQDAWPLLDPAVASDKFPRAIAASPCSWAGRRFSELPDNLQRALRELPLPVVVIEAFDSPDELRDLFIRLQAGTALTRQQIRDAWPGNMSEYIEHIAGKLTRPGRFAFLSNLDRRGSRRDDDDELNDPFHDGRQTAAQLLRLFLDRRRGPIVGVDARALDDLYHSGTDFDRRSPEAAEFERLLTHAEEIVVHRAPITTGRSKAKVSKLRLFTLFLTLVDLDSAPNIRLDRELGKLATAFWSANWWEAASSGLRPGKATSRATIEAHFRWFEENVIVAARLTELDSRRAFSLEEREALWARAAGKCELCEKPAERGDEEYDHVVPWIFGGPTNVENGRAVHRLCNRRRRDDLPEAA